MSTGHRPEGSPGCLQMLGGVSVGRWHKVCLSLPCSLALSLFPSEPHLLLLGVTAIILFIFHLVALIKSKYYISTRFSNRRRHSPDSVQGGTKTSVPCIFPKHQVHCKVWKRTEFLSENCRLSQTWKKRRAGKGKRAPGETVQSLMFRLGQGQVVDLQ